MPNNFQSINQFISRHSTEVRKEQTSSENLLTYAGNESVDDIADKMLVYS